MTVHSTSFPTDQPVLTASTAEALLPAAAAAAPPMLAAKKLNLRKLLLIGASLVAVAGASDFGWRYWTVGRFQVSTDDAYVKADNTTIAPKVPGYIAAVLVGDNERVKAGQILARIDDRDYKVALEQAKADVEAAKAKIANKQARSPLSSPPSQRRRPPSWSTRPTRPSPSRRTSATPSSPPRASAASRMRSRRASRIAARPCHGGARQCGPRPRNKQLDVLKAELGQAQAALAATEAVQDQAELNLSYTTIVTPSTA